MEVVNQILRYLKGTPGLGLFFRKNSERAIETFTDVDGAGSVKDEVYNIMLYICLW